MKLSTHKLLAITEMKFKSLLNKNLIIGPIMTIGMVALLRFMYSAMMEDNQPLDPALISTILNLGLIFNICMTGMFVTSAALAEEKEKYTLRTLMTSSVNAIEFFIGSIIPILFLVMVINIIIVPLSGMSFSDINLGMFLLMSLLASITSCIIGMLIGLFSKNQMSASTLTTPVMIVFMLVPMASTFIGKFEIISRFLFTGVIAEMATAFALTGTYPLKVIDLIVLIGEIILTIIIFSFVYRKNGFEAD